MKALQTQALPIQTSRRGFLRISVLAGGGIALGLSTRRQQRAAGPGRSAAGPAVAQ